MTTIVGKISVFLLAENRLLREALAKILNKKADIAVVGSAPLSSGVVLKITASSPQVLLFDPPHNTRGECSIIPPLHKALPTLKVVMIGMDPDKELFLRAVRDGIAGYMLKDATAPEVADAVRSVAENQAVCPAGLCQALFEYVARQSPAYPNLLVKHHMGLTRREQQLVEMVGRGLTNKEIAVTLGLSEQTIKNHIHRMLRKLGASDRLAAAEMCRTDNSLLPA
jgi:two-component system response regulator DevR